jgi:16S rRNA (adenine1518-N6/adenine1519-N6)-dimethyltransferase
LPRRLGQHFLDHQPILERIAAAAAPEREPLIVEIGPGKGALTSHLLARADRVVAIELDPYLIAYLKQKFREQTEAGRLIVVQSDVLKADLGAWGPAAIAGNLPYYITSPILERVFSIRAAEDGAAGWKRGVFLVQLEVAQRLTAAPGSKDWGFLAVQTQIFSDARLLFEVSRTAFRPPPKVESAVVALTPRPVEPGARAFLSFAGTCFRQKRKTLRNNLLVRYPRELVDRLPEGRLRAEQLSIEQLRSIFARLAAAGEETLAASPGERPAGPDEPALS